MTQKLLNNVLVNIKTDPPAHLDEDFVQRLEDGGTISVTFVSNKKIRDLNRTWRGKDYATDVLSFPLVVADGETDFMTEADIVEFGEVIISVEKALAQAEELGHGFDRELAFLFVHGVLHVLGFDHLTKTQEKDMFQRQNQVLDAAGFKRTSLK